MNKEQEMSQIKSMTVIASEDLNEAVAQLKALRKQMKIMEVQEKKLKDQICAFMGDSCELVDNDGLVAITWATVKDSVRLDADTVKLMYPDVYQECLTTVPGGRRFIVK